MEIRKATEKDRPQRRPPGRGIWQELAARIAKEGPVVISDVEINRLRTGLLHAARGLGHRASIYKVEDGFLCSLEKLS